MGSARKKRLVVLTGAGISAESGIKTFRDAGGLWENYRVEDVATPEAWERNPAMVQEFYNARRRELYKAQPNAAHFALAEAEKMFEIQIITQNIDDLHERAGSSHVLHLHGELKKSRSSKDPNAIFNIEGPDLHIGDLAPDGSQLRPHVVWFGEAVPNITQASNMAKSADLFAVVGSSLNGYPAAGLLFYVPKNIPTFLVDPKNVTTPGNRHVEVIQEVASVGVPIMLKRLEAL